MKTTLQKTAIALGITALAACSAMGWNKEGSQGGSTNTMTGGAEASTTDKGTPQPARPKGSSQSESSGAATSGSSTGDASTGGAEGAPTPEATPGAGMPPQE